MNNGSEAITLTPGVFISLGVMLSQSGGEFDPDARSYRDNVVVSAVLAD